jgi:hypothetical protein
MVDLDPRAKSKVGVETVSGVITDRAIELLGMLNNAIGAEGQLGAKEAEIIFNDGNGNRTETVSNQLIAPNAEDPKWKEDERIFYQATHKRVDLIAQELENSLDEIKDSLVGNITGLFETLAAKENYSADGKKSINELEMDIMNATTTEELIAAQEALEARTEEILTSEEALTEMVNIFFESFELTIQKINDEIFNKLHDFDDDYANGASDIENEKFFFQRTYELPGDIEGEAKPAVILNSKEEVLAKIIEDRKLIHEDRFGAGTYTDTMRESYIYGEVQGKLDSGELKLSDTMIEKIIEERNISEEQLNSIDEMSDFLDLVSLNTLIEYTGIADRKQAIESLFKDHLQIYTPKYYEDQRTIFDILNGKNNDVNSGNTKDRIFSSIDSQMKNVAQGIDDLMRNGYDKVGSSNLQIAIRNNPFAGIEYLESQREAVKELDGIYTELLEEQIEVLTVRQVTHIKNFTEELVRERREIRLSGEENNARIDEINALIDKAVAVELQLRNYKVEDNADTRAKLAELFPDDAAISFDQSGALNYKTFTNAMDPEAKYTRAAKVLYVMEDQESGKKNAEYTTKKLPTPQSDGTIPEDTMPIPPLLSPSPLSAVIAKIGDTVIEKSQALINGDSIPTTDWMVENTSTLMTINEKLSDLVAGSAGEAFLNSLRENFKDVIKEVLTQSSPLKEVQDSIKEDLIKVDAYLGEGFDLNQSAFSTNITSITNSLGANFDESQKKIEQGNNFINLAGVKPVKDYLAENIDALDDVNYGQEIENRLNEIEIINQRERDGTITEEDIARRAQLQGEVRGLRADENNLEAAQNLLYGPGGTAANPQANSVLDLFNNYDQNMNTVIAKRGGLNGQDKIDFLTLVETELGEEFKDAVQEYSNSMSDFSVREDALIDRFKESINDADLDLDGNGENDFVDIENMIQNLNALSENITNTFGGMDAQEGGVDAQSIRRLILLMFLFSILEAGEWDSRLQDASVDRYAIT